MNEGYLQHQGGIVLSKNSNLISDILHELYDSILRGHFRFAHTYHRIKQHIWWMGMKNRFNHMYLVASYVKE